MTHNATCSSATATPLTEIIGQSLAALTTPALVLHHAVFERNIHKLAAYIKPPTRLRPHAKTHKSPRVAAAQVRAGAVGATAATVWEAAALARGGIVDILIANQVQGRAKIRELVETTRLATTTVAVDSGDNARELSAAATAAGLQLGILIEIDIGMGRCGVRSPEAALALAAEMKRLPALRFDGVMGYEGHCSLEPHETTRRRLTNEAIDRLLTHADYIRDAGIEVKTISAGGTGTYNMTGAHPRITELQAGSYAFMDTVHAAVVPDFEFALTVLTSVVSRHGSTVVLDAGKKTLGLDQPPPLLPDIPCTVRYMAEEHTVISLERNMDSPALRSGTRVEVVPSYCPATANLHDYYFVVEDGVVVDVWPIVARGAGWTSLL